MRLGVCAAVDEDVALGLNLAGVEKILVWESSMDPAALKSWYKEMLQKDLGILILSQECSEVLDHELFEKRAQGIMLPVTVIIPGEGEDKRARDLIKRAVGMDPSSSEGI